MTLHARLFVFCINHSDWKQSKHDKAGWGQPQENIVILRRSRFFRAFLSVVDHGFIMMTVWSTGFAPLDARQTSHFQASVSALFEHDSNFGGQRSPYSSKCIVLSSITSLYTCSPMRSLRQSHHPTSNRSPQRPDSSLIFRSAPKFRSRR